MDQASCALAEGLAIQGFVNASGPELLTAVFSDAQTILLRLLSLAYADAYQTTLAGLISPAELAAFQDVRREVIARAGPRPTTTGARLASAYPADAQAVELHRKLRLDSRVPKVPDRFLARAIEALTRQADRTTGGLVELDYRLLGPGQLGTIYEGLRGSQLVRQSNGTLALARLPRARKASGVYYTPEAIAREVIASTIEPALQEHLARLLAAPGAITADALFAFRVLDPAMGCGHFLLAAVDALAAGYAAFLRAHHMPSIEEILGRRVATEDADPAAAAASSSHDPWLTALRETVLERCVYGVDLDPRAVELARVALALHCSSPSRGPTELPRQLRHGDSLVGPVAVEFPTLAAGFDWESEFPEVFPRENNATDSALACPSPRGFDAIVGNPPWISYSGRQAAALAPELAAYYRRHFRAAQGWLSTQGLFLERSASLLRPGGWLGLVVPAQIADLDGFAATRAALAALGDVREPCRYHGEAAFRQVVGPAITVCFQRGPGPASPDRRPWRLAEAAGAPTPESQRLITLAARLRALEPFGAAAFGDPGVHTGNAARELLVAEPGPGRVPLREGRDVRPFQLGAPRIYLQTDLEPRPGRYFRVGPADRYLGCPILVRQTASRPIAALHENPAHFRNSVLAARGLPDVPAAAVVALLNSELFAWLHRQSHRDARQRSFPQVKVSHLRALPRPPAGADPAILDRLAALVGQLNPRPDRAPGDLGVTSPRALDPGQLALLLDDLVFELYAISEAERAAIRAHAPDRDRG